MVTCAANDMHMHRNEKIVNLGQSAVILASSILHLFYAVLVKDIANDEH